jgi:hypothetical protein
MNKWLYEFFYRIPYIPISWIFGSAHEQREYKQLLDTGRIPKGRAIDLGCGEGSKNNANTEGVEVTFLEDDLTNLHHIEGTFDLLVDFGALNDLNEGDRNLYMKNVFPLTHPGSYFILMSFTKSLSPAEVEKRFGDQFNIENLKKQTESITARTIDLYLMTSP